MRKAIRYAFLLVILAVVGAEAESQRPAVFGRPRDLPEVGHTIYVGAWEQAHLKARCLGETNVLIAFPESYMTVSADSARFGENGDVILTGVVTIKMDTDARAVSEKLIRPPN